MSTRVFSVTIETCGPSGDAFAIGVSVREDGKEVAHFSAWHPVEATAHYDPAHWRDMGLVRSRVSLLLSTPVYETPRKLRACFWAFYLKWGACGATVLSNGTGSIDRLFHACATEAGASWRPYEFSEFGTRVVAHGALPAGDRGADERPEGHPLCEARRAGRLWSPTGVPRGARQQSRAV